MTWCDNHRPGADTVGGASVLTKVVVKGVVLEPEAAGQLNHLLVVCCLCICWVPYWYTDWCSPLVLFRNTAHVVVWMCLWLLLDKHLGAEELGPREYMFKFFFFLRNLQTVEVLKECCVCIMCVCMYIYDVCMCVICMYVWHVYAITAVGVRCVHIRAYVALCCIWKSEGKLRCHPCLPPCLRQVPGEFPVSASCPTASTLQSGMPTAHCRVCFYSSLGSELRSSGRHSKCLPRLTVSQPDSVFHWVCLECFKCSKRGHLSGTWVLVTLVLSQSSLTFPWSHLWFYFVASGTIGLKCSSTLFPIFCAF